MWLQGLKVRILLLTSVRTYLNTIINLNKNFIQKSPYFALIILQRWVNFIREGFLIDYLQKKLFDTTVLNWIAYGAVKINLTFVNIHQIRTFFYTFEGFYDLINLKKNSGLGSFFTLVSLYFFFIAGLIIVVYGWQSLD